MKTFFSRNFYPAVIVTLIALLSVGLLLQLMVKNIMKTHTFEKLETQACAVAQLAAAYEQTDPDSYESFLIGLSMSSHVSDSKTVICDHQGYLMLCSDSPMGCEHQGMLLSSDHLSKVSASTSVSSVGIIEGLYEDPRYIVSVPILSAQGEMIGIVVSSTSVSTTQVVLHAMTRIYLFSSLAAILLSVLIMIWVARRHSRPLIQMRQAAVDFSHGKMDARASVQATDPDEIQELALAFNNMADFLQKSDYRRQEFIANISHELKTPMTTISGFADGILDGTIPPEKQNHYLKLISHETKRLSRLVKGMLETTRLQENKQVSDQQKQRFDLSECIGQILLSFEQKITAKKLAVHVDFPDYPVYTWANQDPIIQVVYNLLDNAVKFCPQEGELSLKLRPGGSKLYFSVINSGKTIPPEELPLVFDRFHKLDKSRSENRDGWGLGLYIVKAIICAHGENISVASKDGKTEFTFTLPLIN